MAGNQCDYIESKSVRIYTLDFRLLRSLEVVGHILLKLLRYFSSILYFCKVNRLKSI